MKYLALLSGGKDSCYNLLHCKQNGHELVAAASLGPEPGKEELDSYLYQTVGQDAIEFVARALDVPLYRRVITGNAVEQGSEYGGRDHAKAGGITGDETEDLYELLSTVKEHHPDVKGVSVGAILSNYQRVRVEHVCRRLDLTPLCYLWQRNQAELLSEMVEAGMEAILIKVAGIGLTTAHLGKTLAQMQPTLTKLNSLYGLHVCGEGGEYETLTLDCPMYKHRIRLTDVETVIHSDNDFATVAYMRIKGAELEAKAQDVTEAHIPPTLDDEYVAVHDAVVDSQQQNNSPDPLLPGISETFVSDGENNGPRSRKRGNWVTISNIESSRTGESTLSVEDEVADCFSILKDLLQEHSLQLAQISNINILISSMDLFVRVNQVYGSFFGTSPPARACVGVDLPEGVRVRLECTAHAEQSPSDRQALHVQGLSYWAPANIGPYSQAIIVGERIFISGQIGLIPSKLVLPSPPSLATELALSSQHVARVTQALQDNVGGSWTAHTQLAIYWLASSDDLAHVKRGHSALSTSTQCPTLFIVVKELPKDAQVEKQVLLHTGGCNVIDDYDGEAALQNTVPVFQQKSAITPDGHALSWELSLMKEDQSACLVIYIKGEPSAIIKDVAAELSPMLDSSLSLRYFHKPQSSQSINALWEALSGSQELPPVTPITCRMIANIDRDDWDVALCIILC